MVWSVGGTGTALRACTRVGDDGIFDATTWVTLLYLPVRPLHRARYRLIERRSRFPGPRTLKLQRLEALELRGSEVVRTYLLAWLGAPAALALPTAALGLPGVLAGRPDFAAAGAVLSSLWVIPVGVGVLVWIQGLPWARNPTRAELEAMAGALRRSAGATFLAVAAVCGFLGLLCGGLRVGIDSANGLDLAASLRGGGENAAFFLVLGVAVAPVLWVASARRAADPPR